MATRAHVPERTCVGCGAKEPKRQLLRVVLAPDGAPRFDPTGRSPGRGAYIHPVEACVLAAGRGRQLAHALHARADPGWAASLVGELRPVATAAAGAGAKATAVKGAD